MLMSRGKE